jgi:hypothetical protein
MAFGDQDLDIFFRDGTEVRGTDDALLFMAHFDVPERVESFGVTRSPAGQITGHPQIRFATADAPSNFRRGLVVKINGTRYELRSDPEKQNDGLESIADLKLSTT